MKISFQSFMFIPLVIRIFFIENYYNKKPELQNSILRKIL
jgi:hypothetical protein